jgi:membrane-associated phospholipid phosphatase
MRVAFLAWIVASRAPRLRVPLAIVVAVVAFGRVYLAASWAADVAGGILLGIALAALAELVGERLAAGQRAPRAALATPVAR